ncbi:MAG: HdeD family acid-resistance protein [Chloroflexi bacterium]|nr:MAG: HdeD family acid-resistance protein [Chloroflexota bacterium]
MLEAISAQVVLQNWWMLVVRGVLALIFGLIALFFPKILLLVFIVVFAVYAIIDGIFAVIVALRERQSWKRWGWVLAEGMLSILAGIFALVFPGLTALILLYIIAAWAILTGIAEIVAAVALREYLSHEWALVLAGVLSLVFGLLLFTFPLDGILSLLWLVGVYTINPQGKHKGLPYNGNDDACQADSYHCRAIPCACPGRRGRCLFDRYWPWGSAT